MSKKQYGILRIAKYTRGSVRGIERHDLRLAKVSKTNGDIDYSRTHKNYELWNRNGESFNRAVSERIARLKLKKAVRKDAIVMVQAMVTASPTFFDKMSDDKIRQYFQKCLDFLSKKYGKENIVSATVHLDEKTPHMHVNFVPATKDNRLCAKDLFKRQDLRQLQDEAYSQIFQQYGLDRGIRNKVQHISTLNYKILTLQEKERKLSKKIEKVEDRNVMLKMKKDLDSTRSMLSQMFDVLESDPKLMKEYKIAAERYKKAKNRNMEQREI